MRWYVSYPILAAGLAFGFDTFFPDAPDLSRTADAKLQTRAHAEPEAPAPIVMTAEEIEALPRSRLAAFSPGAKLAFAQPPPSLSVLDYLAQTISPPESTPVPALQVTATGWTSAVVREAPAAAQPAPAARPAQPLSRAALARDIQRELQRVGCYLGEIDGVWGGGSKRAVLVFMDRVNASLPTREPDVFMLSLLRAQTTAVCGESCPRGQSFTAGGRCVPSTLVAQAGKQAPSASAEATVAEAAAAPRPVPYGRMGIGGPRPDDVAELSGGWTSVTSVPRQGEPLDRTAALDTPPADVEIVPEDARAVHVAPSSFDMDADAMPVRRAKPSAGRKTRERPVRRSSSYRQVQHLFMHPLGRM